MVATISNYNKHLKLSERIKIEKYLDEGKSFRFISRELNKGINTISREIKNRRYKEKGNILMVYQINFSFHHLNFCIYNYKIKKTNYKV